MPTIFNRNTTHEPPSENESINTPSPSRTAFLRTPSPFTIANWKPLLNFRFILSVIAVLSLTTSLYFVFHYRTPFSSRLVRLYSNKHGPEKKLAFLNAFDDKEYENIAFRASCVQSSTWFGLGSYVLTDGKYGASAPHSHSKEEEFAYVDLDLKKVYPIETIRVWNRMDTADPGITGRLVPFWMMISLSPFPEHCDLSQSKGTATLAEKFTENNKLFTWQLKEGYKARFGRNM